MRELGRVARAESGARPTAGARWWAIEDAPVRVAGYSLPAQLLDTLERSEPVEPSRVPIRIVRLSGDPAPADRHADAAPAWRRSEPVADHALSQTLADDIADWIAICEPR